MRKVALRMARPPLALRFLPVAVMGAAHLAALVFAELGTTGAAELAGATELWLMPALLVSFLWAIPAVRSGIALWGTLALVFSWAGDVLLATPGGSGFLLGLGGFFLAHVAYLVLILRFLKRGRLPWVANRMVAIGAVFFLVFDSILGLSLFVPNFDFWQIDFVIMVAYLLGQTLIAGGAVRHALQGITPAKAPLPPE
jgi:uncharacterized membrane protein YhhN